jgi:hypothetical protein
MATASITQILDNISALQAASRTDSKDAFDISGSAFALCAKTAFTPQDRLPYRLFSPIVRRFHPHIIHKCPQKVPLVEDSTALTRQGFAAVSAEWHCRIFLK